MKKNQESFNGTAISDSRVAVILTRVSSKEQAEGITIQEKECLEYAKENDIEVVNVLRLFGGGLNEKPEPYYEMIAKSKAVNTLLISSYDRLSRKNEEIISIVDYLNRRGIYVISTTPLEYK